MRAASRAARNEPMPNPFDDDDTTAAPGDPIAALAAAGMTADEIGLQLGMDADAVRASPSYADAPLTPACDQRAARALYERAVGSTTWAESVSKLGEVRRLYRREQPDTAAARMYLQARAPDRWGTDKPEAARVYVVALPSVAHDAQSWLASVQADRARTIEHDAGPRGASDGRGGE